MARSLQTKCADGFEKLPVFTVKMQAPRRWHSRAQFRGIFPGGLVAPLNQNDFMAQVRLPLRENPRPAGDEDEYDFEGGGDDQELQEMINALSEYCDDEIVKSELAAIKGEIKEFNSVHQSKWASKEGEEFV